MQKATVVMVIKSAYCSEQGKKRINKTLCNVTGLGQRGNLDRSQMSPEESEMIRGGRAELSKNTQAEMI